MAGTAGGSWQRHPATGHRVPLRASDADREEAVARLRDRFAAGQMSQDTFVHRMEVALAARDHGELDGLLADLPLPRPRGSSAWSDLGARFAAALSPVKDAVTAPVRRMSRPRRDARPPALTFPAGSQLRFTIGRDPDCDLVIPDITVSRQHAGLDRSVRGWLLTDFGSTNGTRLNGWRVREPVPVAPGDRVSFGAVTFVLRPGR